MSTLTRISFSLGLLFLCTFILSPTSSGQSVWLDPTVESSVSLEILKPDFWTSGYGEGAEAYSTVWFLSSKVRIGMNAFWLFELPSSHYDATFLVYLWPGGSTHKYDIDGQSMIGNPLIGVEYRNPVSSFYAHFGLRLPVAEDSKSKAAAQGVLADVSRMEAFFPDVMTFRLRAGVRTQVKSGLGYHIFLGPCYLKPVGDLSGADSEIYLDYGSQLWFVTEKAKLGAGFVGQLLVTSDGDGLGESSLHEFGIAASFLSGRFRPGAHLRVPLDDDWPGLQYVWGLNFQISLDSN